MQSTSKANSFTIFILIPNNSMKESSQVFQLLFFACVITVKKINFQSKKCLWLYSMYPRSRCSFWFTLKLFNGLVVSYQWFIKHIDGVLLKEKLNSSALAMEFCLSCINPLACPKQFAIVYTYSNTLMVSDGSLIAPTFLKGLGMAAWVDRAYIDSVV